MQSNRLRNATFLHRSRVADGERCAKVILLLNVFSKCTYPFTGCWLRRDWPPCDVDWDPTRPETARCGPWKIRVYRYPTTHVGFRQVPSGGTESLKIVGLRYQAHFIGHLYDHIATRWKHTAKNVRRLVHFTILGAKARSAFTCNEKRSLSVNPPLRPA